MQSISTLKSIFPYKFIIFFFGFFLSSIHVSQASIFDSLGNDNEEQQIITIQDREEANSTNDTQQKETSIISDLDNSEQVSSGSERLGINNVEAPTLADQQQAYKINQGEFLESAQILVIDTSIGKKYDFKIAIGETLQFEGLTITAAKCWQEQQGVYRPESKALITMQHDNEVIFHGWILSQHRALSQPIYRGYFICLQSCLPSNDEQI